MRLIITGELHDDITRAWKTEHLENDFVLSLSSNVVLIEIVLTREEAEKIVSTWNVSNVR